MYWYSEDFSTKIVADPEELMVAGLSETSANVVIQLVGLFDTDSIRRLMWIMRKQKFEKDLLKLPDR